MKATTVVCNALKIAGVALALLFLFYLFTRNEFDPDLPGHLTFGLETWRTGAVPQVDLYSYTAYGRPWIDHEWLMEVIWGQLILRGGIRALVVAKLVICSLLALLVGMQVYRSCRNGLIAALVMTLTLLAVQPGLSFRPQLFTYLLLAVTVWLAPPHLPLSRRRLLAVVPVLLLWANLHGGFIAGLGYLFLLGLGRAIERMAGRRCPDAWRDQLRIGWYPLVFLAATAATLANPYGWKMWYCVGRALSNPHTREVITEWRAVGSGAGDLARLSFLLLLVLVLWTALIARKRYPGRTVLTLTVPLLMALLAVRNIPLFAILAAGPVAAALAARLRLCWHRFSPVIAVLLLVIVLAGCARYLIVLDRSFSWDTITVPEGRYPRDAVRFLSRYYTDYRNLAVPFNWGEYVIWHLWPDYLVSLDGRYDTVYPLEVFTDFQLKIFAGAPDALDLLRKYNTELVLAPTDSPLVPMLLGSSDWIYLYRSPEALIFVKNPPLPLIVLE